MHREPVELKNQNQGSVVLTGPAGDVDVVLYPLRGVKGDVGPAGPAGDPGIVVGTVAPEDTSLLWLDTN